MPEKDGFEKGSASSSKPESTHTASDHSISNKDLDIYHVRRVVAGNPNTPLKVLARLAKDPQTAIRVRVAENPRTTVEVLSDLAADDHSEVRLAVAENPNSPAEILSMLAGDEDADVRYGVAENPHMPENILVKLSEDDNPYVRCRALKTVQMLEPDVQSRLMMLLQGSLEQKQTLG